MEPLGTAGAALELPHHAGEKSAGPIGPQFAGVMPLAADGVDGKKIGMFFRQREHLFLGKFQRLRVAGNSSIWHSRSP